jgi:hypothetical protein
VSKISTANGDGKTKSMQLLAFIASVITAIQTVAELSFGSMICPNAGCEVVQNLTVLPPLYLNILGLLFFQAVFWWRRLQKKTPRPRPDLLGLFLLCGLLFESVLLAYQIFTVQSFCGYCLLIFGLVLALNLLYGRRQILAAIAVSAAALTAFALLTFIPTGVLSHSDPLKTAAFGLKSCSKPTKEIYLIFSSNCPYCENVLQTLSNCNSCDLYLNPVDRIEAIDNIPLEPNPDFSPATNRLVLAVLGIDSVPVLIVKNPDGYRFIKGESKIVNYVRQACFTEADVLYLEESIYGSEGITVYSEPEGKCSLEIECE